MEHSTYEYYFSEFIKKVSYTHDIDPEILISYLNDITNKPFNITLEEIDKESIKSSASTIKQKNEYCTYVYCRGEMAGKTCGIKLRSESNKYCCKHKIYENRNDVKRSSILPVGKRSKKDDDNDKDDNKSSKNTDTKNIILRLNRDIKKMWHPATGLVFNDDYKVYGYYDRENKEIENLNSKYIDLCKKYNFKYIKNTDES